MARSFNGTSTYWMEYASGGAVTTYPYTFACWARRQGTNSGANRHHIFGQATDAASGPMQMLTWNPATNRAELLVRDAAGGGAESYASWSDTGVWHHLCGCHISSSGANQLLFWLDGVSGTSGYGGDSGLGNRIRVSRAGWSDYWFNGYVAECAIWAAQLTNEEVAALAARVSPLLIRPQSLRFYAPMWGRGGSSANEPDYIAARTLTQTGSPTVVESPPMIYPPQRRIRLAADAAPPPAFPFSRRSRDLRTLLTM